MSQPTSSSTKAIANYCAIDSCRSLEYPLHYVYYQNRFVRLCNNCVLGLNPGNFCTHCLSPFYGAPHPAIVHCSQCQMLAHLNCVQNPNFATRFLCPSCRTINGSRFRWFSHESGTSISDHALRGLYLGASLAYGMNKKAVMKMKEELNEKFDAMVDSELEARSLVEACQEGVERMTNDHTVFNAPPKIGVSSAIRPFVGSEGNASIRICKNLKAAKWEQDNPAFAKEGARIRSHGLTQSTFQAFGSEIVNFQEARTSVPTRSAVIPSPSSAYLIPEPRAVYMHN